MGSDYRSAIRVSRLRRVSVRKNLYITFLILAVLVITGAYAGSSDSITSASFQNNVLNNEIVFSIPLGDNGIHYSGKGNPDMLTWGPTALTDRKSVV